MDTYPETFAFLQIHRGDSYTTAWANQRHSFYASGGYPTSYFDGVIERVGAYPYTTYLSDYNNRRNVATDVTIELKGEQISGQTFNLQADVCIEPGGTGKTMRIYMVEALDYWPIPPSYSRNGFRQAVDTEDITLAAGGCQTVIKEITFDSISWGSQEDIKILAWAQEPQSTGGPGNRAEIYQGAVMTWPFPTPGPPINDDCVDATIAGNQVFNGTTELATNDGSASCGTSDASPDIWWRYTPEFDGVLNVDSCNSSFDTVVSVHEACPGDTGIDLGCNDDSEECGAGATQGYVSVPVTAGVEYIVRLSGADGDFGQYSVFLNGPDDLDPPEPNPMTWDVEPYGTSTVRVAMVATPAFDVLSPPAEYYFDFATGGSGGTDSGWQSGNQYEDVGLSRNTGYTYRVKTRDARGNISEYSEAFEGFTLASPPGFPWVPVVGPDMMIIDIHFGGNPSYTEFAIQCDSSLDPNWDQMFVDADGNPSVTEVWRTGDDWGADQVIQGLAGETEYCWHVKARNGNGVETDYGLAICRSTVGATVEGAYSCRTHGDAGEYCTELGIGDGTRFTGDNLEWRLGGVAEIELATSLPINDFSATVDCAVDTAFASTVTAIADGSTTAYVQFDPALPADDCCTITFEGDLVDVRAIATLQGSVDGNLIVNTIDSSAVKARFGQSVDSSNFTYDVNADGIISSLDFSAIKARFGNSLTSCP